jgi:hypothetical protein
MKPSSAFCYLTLLCSLSTAALGENTRTLSTPETIHGSTLPAGTQLTETDAGEPIAAVLNTQIVLRSVVLPPGSEILFFDDADFGIVHSIDAAASSTVAFVGDGVGRTLSSICSGSPAFRTNIANSVDLKAHFAEDFSLSHMDLSFHTQDNHFGILKSKYESSDVRLPPGTLIDNMVQTVYFPSAGRIGPYEVEPGTLLWHPGVWDVYTRNAIKLGDFEVAAKGNFDLSGDGNIVDFLNSASISMAPGLTAPPRSRVFFIDNKLFVVDLSGPATYQGLHISGQFSACFTINGVADVVLDQDAVIGGDHYARGSRLNIAPNGTLLLAAPALPTSAHGFSVAASPHTVTFYDSGNVRDLFLTEPTTFKGIKVQGYTALTEDGHVTHGNLVGDQTISGIPCMGGTDISLTGAQVPIDFTAASDFTIRDTHLHRGQRFLGTAEVKGTKVVLDPAHLAQAVNSIHADLVQKANDAIKQASSKFPFGNIGTIQDHDFRWSASGHELQLHQEFSVQNLFTNPPFSDCDAQVHIDITVRWMAFSGFYGAQIVAWPASIGGGYSHGVCPGTAALEAVAAVGRIFSHIRELMDQKITQPLQALAEKSVIQRQLSSAALSQYDDVIKFAEPGFLDHSVGIDDLVVDSGSLKLSYHYAVRCSSPVCAGSGI